MFALFAAALLAADPPLVHRIAPGVFHREAERGRRILAVTSWIEFRDSVLVVDANFPWAAEDVLEDVRRTTGKPVRHVFNTHHHADHSFGNAVFDRAAASIVCSRGCLEASLAGNPEDWNVKLRTWPGAQLAPYSLAQPHSGFDARLVFDDGARRVELIALEPAHTAGDAVAWLPREHILFTGDLCVNAPWSGNNVADPKGDPEGWLRALDRLAALGPALVVPGHGAPGGPEILRRQRAYLADLIALARRGVASGWTVEEALARGDLSSHGAWGASERWNRDSLRALYERFRGKTR